uniref:Uncharacterized protein n=1 Tax=Marmota marmota marmota TaxID=9994 RepID=A0A8C5ZLV3_MARMA
MQGVIGKSLCFPFLGAVLSLFLIACLLAFINQTQGMSSLSPRPKGVRIQTPLFGSCPG